jgi:PncC family amidohydrolase
VPNIEEIAAEIARRLIERGQSVAVAESAAGGLISAALLAVPGASTYFKGGVVVYNADAKERLAGMTRQELEADRSATAPHAAALARAVRRRLGADWAIAETGAAGPTGNRYGDPAGHVAMAIDGPNCRTAVHRTGRSDRQPNMAAFALAALELLLSSLDDAGS